MKLRKRFRFKIDLTDTGHFTLDGAGRSGWNGDD